MSYDPAAIENLQRQVFRRLYLDDFDHSVPGMHFNNEILRPEAEVIPNSIDVMHELKELDEATKEKIELEPTGGRVGDQTEIYSDGYNTHLHDLRNEIAVLQRTVARIQAIHQVEGMGQ